MDKLHVNKWYVDAAFSVISYFKHHNGGIKNYGNKFPILKWRKQKLNTRSSTNSELVGTDNMSTMIFRKIFMEVQGYRIKNMLISTKITRIKYQCNKIDNRVP